MVFIERKRKAIALTKTFGSSEDFSLEKRDCSPFHRLFPCLLLKKKKRESPLVFLSVPRISTQHYLAPLIKRGQE